MSFYTFEVVKLENAKVKPVFISPPAVPSPNVCEVLRACRACLTTDAKLFNLQECELAKMFGELTGTPVMASDGLPQHICSMCSVMLCKSSAFTDRCLRAQGRWQDLKGSVPMVTIENIQIVHKSLPNLMTDFSKTKPLIIEIPPEDTSDIKTVPPISPEQVFIKDVKAMKKTHKDFIEIEVAKIENINKIEDGILKDDKDVVEISDDIELPEDNFSDLDDDELDEYIYSKKKTVRRRKPKELNMEVPQTTSKKYFDQMTKFAKKFKMDLVILSEEEQIAKVAERKESWKYKKAQHKCELCYRFFGKEEALKHHVETFHPSDAPIVCKYCRFRFPTRRRLVQHHRNVHWRLFVCHRCGLSTTGLTQVRKHCRLHNDSTITHYKCPLCWKSFLEKKARVQHILGNHAKSPCHLCGETFNHGHKFFEHVETIHKEAQSHRCEYCGLPFQCADAASRHQQFAVDSVCSAQDRPCGHCGDNIETDDVLQLHLREKHGKQCKRCDFIYTSPSEYREHSLAAHFTRVQMRHAGGRKRRATQVTSAQGREILCEICGYKTSRPVDLKRHQSIHSGELAYPCYWCPKRFRSDRHLVVHLKSHNEERPYKCEECPLAFKFKSALNRHILIHRDIRRYRCEICGRAFVQSSALYCHIDGVHKKMPKPRQIRKPRKSVTASRKKVNEESKAKRTRVKEKTKEDNMFDAATDSGFGFMEGYSAQ